jgi:hypothetical protein
MKEPREEHAFDVRDQLSLTHQPVQAGRFLETLKRKNNLKSFIWHDLLIGSSFSYKNNVIMTKCVKIPSTICLKFISHSFKRRSEVSPLLFHSFIIHYFIIH